MLDIHTWTVSELTHYIKNKFERDPQLVSLLLKGELSNFRRHQSGHCYFTLKDAAASIRCVMFRSRVQSLRFNPVDGLKVLSGGHVSVYDKDGTYQFYVDTLAPDGIGDLSLALAQLKAKLATEGLFDVERKKMLPLLPVAVGLVTSPTGAALRDIIKVSRRRHPGIPLVLFPVHVQGNEAPEQIVRAIEFFNHKSSVDVIITGRGGGSMEELFAFNDERVVSAVGHETDFTLADFVADVRAATPSQAAEMVIPDRQEWERRIQSERQKLGQLLKYRAAEARIRLERCLTSRLFRLPQEMLQQYHQTLDDCRARLEEGLSAMLETKQRELDMQMEKLKLLNPLAVMDRGFSVVRKANGPILLTAQDVRSGDVLKIQFRHGSAVAQAIEVEEVDGIEKKDSSDS